MSSTLVQSPTRPNYIPALDGVRLLAVLFVIVHHITSGSHASIFRHLIGLQRGNGIGPTLFFVLSGVLLTTVIIKARNAQNRYRNFLMRRVLRIFPLYFAYLALAVAVTWFITGTPPQNFWVLGLFLQNTFVNAAANTHSLVPTYHFWTLAVQDQFYLFWPLLIWGCTSIRRMRHLCYAIIVFSLLTRIAILYPPMSPALLGRTLPARAGEMALGALISLEAFERTTLTAFLRKAFLPLSLGCAVWMWFGLEILSPLGSTLGLQLLALVCAALVAAALAPGSWTSTILGSKYFALGGKKYAFAMYIFHPLLLDLCVNHMPMLPKLAQLSIFAVATVAISALSYRYYEHPFLKMPVGHSRSQPEEGVQNRMPKLVPSFVSKLSVHQTLKQSVTPERTN